METFGGILAAILIAILISAVFYYGFSARGPCPPEGEEHRYFFKVYALDSKIALDPDKAEKEALEILIEEKRIGYGELVGLYKKS